MAERRRAALGPGLLGLALVLGILPGRLAACSRPPAPRTTGVEVRQDDLDDDQRLVPTLAATAARVLHENRAFLGAHAVDFCPRMSPDQRRSCLDEVASAAATEIAGPVDVIETAEMREGGKEWPNAGSVDGFRRVRLSVPLRRGNRTTTHEAQIVVFDSHRGDRDEQCVFPLEHWSWSEMDLPERFAQAPMGECDGRPLTVTEYLLESLPEGAPMALRFLSEPEARAWKTGDPERIKWDSPYTAGHPYAKFFLFDSTRWWRGGRSRSRRDAYAWAVRVDGLPLARVRALEESGDAFLDVFEDAAQIELTSVTKAGLEALLREKPAVLADVSGPDDDAPRFVPAD